MPRGGRGSSRSSSSSSSRSSSPTRPAQAPPRPTQAPVQSSGGMGSGFMGTLVQGMAFGAGSEVAHQAVRGVMGGNSHSQAPQQEAVQQQPQQYQANRCQTEASNFTECLKFNNNQIAQCQDQFNQVQQCQSTNF